LFLARSLKIDGYFLFRKNPNGFLPILGIFYINFFTPIFFHFLHQIFFIFYTNFFFIFYSNFFIHLKVCIFPPKILFFFHQNFWDSPLSKNVSNVNLRHIKSDSVLFRISKSLKKYFHLRCHQLTVNYWPIIYLIFHTITTLI